MASIKALSVFLLIALYSSPTNTMHLSVSAPGKDALLASAAFSASGFCFMQGFKRSGWKTTLAWEGAGFLFAGYGIYALDSCIAKSPALLQDGITLAAFAGACAYANKAYKRYTFWQNSNWESQGNYEKNKRSHEFKVYLGTSVALSALSMRVLYKNHHSILKPR